MRDGRIPSPARWCAAFAGRGAFDPLDIAVGGESHLIGHVRHASSNPLASRAASAGLSISRPISVFRRAERGSKLNEPTKMRAAVDARTSSRAGSPTSCRRSSCLLSRRRPRAADGLSSIEPHAGARAASSRTSRSRRARRRRRWPRANWSGREPSRPARRASASAAVPSSPGTKYGDTRSNDRCGAPESRSELGSSRIVGPPVVSSVLRRIVADQLRASPTRAAARRRAARARACVSRRASQVGARCRIGAHLLERSPRASAAAPAGRGPAMARRVRRGAVPVPVELRRDIAHDRADRDDVEVREPDPLARAEVLVADVAAADDRHLVVGGERLVVHAAVQRAKSVR